MTILPLMLIPDAVLRETAKPVKQITPAHKTLLKDMLETMYDAPGIGLAANQIGSLERLIVMDCNPQDSEEQDPELGPYMMINPEIIWSSEEKNQYEEGCLSIPDGLGKVTRPAEVTVRYLDCEGNSCELQASGLLATCVQHEIDHLNGVLFIDYLSKLKRDMISKKVKKYRQEREGR